MAKLSGGRRGAPAGSAAGGLATVAETDGVDPASPSSSPAEMRLLQDTVTSQQNLLDDAAQQHLQQQQILAAQAQVAQLFGGPGGLQQAQATLFGSGGLQQAQAVLLGGNGGPPAQPRARPRELGGAPRVKGSPQVKEVPEGAR